MTAVALGVAAVAAAAIAAAPDEKRPNANTPPEWSYDVRNGKRVPRVPRVTNPDGSWTEEFRAANCNVTRTGRNGEVRETRKCD
jgi:hypothetical protein